MKIGVFSDVHGNFIAFSHCMHLFMELGVERLYFLGDAVGYLPEAHMVLEGLQQNQVQCLKGNHEAMLLGELPYTQQRERIYRLEQANAALQAGQREYVARWPQSREVKFGESRVLLLHGGIADPLIQYVYPDSSMEQFRTMEYDMVFMGHTHHPFIAEVEGKRIVNVGSCGLPRDQGNMLSFALYDTDSDSCEIVRSQINIEQVLERYSDIDDSVKACLRRIAQKAIVGKIL